MSHQPAVLVGQAIGDALGMPFEKPSDEVAAELADWPGDYRAGTYLPLPAGHWTDDTEMAMCLAESLIATRGHDPADVAARYLAWAQGSAFGIGSTTREAMDQLAAGADHRHSGVRFERKDWVKVGNGTAMRVAPLGVMFDVATRRDDLRRACRVDAETTHVHREARAASLLVATAVSMLVDRPGLGRAELLAALRDELDEVEGAEDGRSQVAAALPVVEAIAGAEVGLEDAIATLGRRGNAVQTTMTALLCAVRHLDDFAGAVTAAVRGGGDADTRGAITGAIVGARVGLAGIPATYRDNLHRGDELVTLDAQLLALRGR